MVKKTIDTLVQDIQGLFNGHGFSEALEHFSSDLGETFKKRFEEYGTERASTLRLSNYGKPLRQLYYELNNFKRDSELPASARTKFLFGDILESLLILLAKESGHEVKDQQREVTVDGVLGHIDCVIDGVLIDVKSASTHSFRNFASGSIRISDPFGYIPQLAAYSKGLGGCDGGFLVIDKTLGNIHLERFSKEELESYPVSKRIAEDRLAVIQKTPPERCYKPVPLSKTDKSGNLVLPIGCSYCAWMKTCWADSNDGKGVQTYLYANGPKHFVHINKTPKVEKQEEENSLENVQ